MRLFSNIISGMFHPLLMVTYGVVLALTFTYLAIYPPAMKLLLAGGAFLSTAVIPGAFIFMMVKNGAAVDMELSDRHERVVPYLIFITSIMVCAFYMYKMMLPFWFISLLLGACVAFIIVILIAGLVGTSRIFLKRHTPMQVYAGFCLGFICTFVASFLSYIYLFI